MKLWFGRHRGRALPDVPRGYLFWIIGTDDLDVALRHAARTELRRRGERYLPASIVLADLEELLTERISEDPCLEHAVAGIVSDHVLSAFEQLRETHRIGCETELVVPAQRNPLVGGG